MPSIAAAELPTMALLQKYAAPVGYADCFVTRMPGVISHERFVRAFYTSPLFKVERAILKWLASRPSTDEDAAALASGQRDKFAAWRVEGRSEGQLLLADETGRTRSWLMARVVHGTDGPGTSLYFGSAVLPRVHRTTGAQSMGPAFSALLGLHRLYSRELLRAAARGLRK